MDLVTLTPLKFFNTTEKEGILLNSFIEVSITQTAKLDKKVEEKTPTQSL